MNELALFAGAGGGILGSTLLGWHTVCAVERDAYAASVLAQRQNDGCLDCFPIWSDVESFDGRPWRGAVDVVSGGFPCQDISVCGRAAGIEGDRSGLWGHMARIIGEVRPPFAFVENSPALLVRGIGRVIGDLSEMGYVGVYGVIGARHFGGPVERERLWIACADKVHGQAWMGDRGKAAIQRRVRGECPTFWLQAPPVSFGVGDGLDSYMDQVGAIGNGQVPAVAAGAWRILTAGLTEAERMRQ
jgi:DNA (cytosine-5)-methyltransferase 1